MFLTVAAAVTNAAIVALGRLSDQPALRAEFANTTTFDAQQRIAQVAPATRLVDNVSIGDLATRCSHPACGGRFDGRPGGRATVVVQMPGDKAHRYCDQCAPKLTRQERAWTNRSVQLPSSLAIRAAATRLALETRAL